MRNIIKILFIITFNYNYSFAQETFPVNGVADNFKPVHAFINAHIIVSSSKKIKNGTLLIKDNIILNVDSNLTIPEGAIIHDLNGDYIYPSFIDLYSEYGLKKPKKKDSDYRPQYESKKKGAYHWNQAIHPEVHASHQFYHNKDDIKKYLEMGFGSVLSHLNDGIFRGTGCFTVLSNNRENEDLLIDQAATFYSFNKGSSNDACNEIKISSNSSSPSSIDIFGLLRCLKVNPIQLLSSLNKNDAPKSIYLVFLPNIAGSKELELIIF